MASFIKFASKFDISYENEISMYFVSFRILGTFFKTFPRMTASELSWLVDFIGDKLFFVFG